MGETSLSLWGHESSLLDQSLFLAIQAVPLTCKSPFSLKNRDVVISPKVTCISKEQQVFILRIMTRPRFWHQ